MTSFRAAAVAAVVVTALVWALPAMGRTAAPTATTTVVVSVGKPSEFKFALSKKAVKAGTVVFKVTNKGALPHDFKIAGKKTKMLQPGKSQTLKVVFKKKGSYPYICTVSGHAAAGMKGVLKVG